MTADKSLLTTDYGQDANRRRERRSQSDTAINIASRVCESIIYSTLTILRAVFKWNMIRGQKVVMAWYGIY